MAGSKEVKLSDAGIALIKEYEGLRLGAYQDSVGVWTIGYGSTSGVTEGMWIKEEEAEARLREDVSHAENCVNRLVSVPLTEGEFDALVSFVFNLGCARLRDSTLLRKLNDSDYDGAVAEFRRWNKAGGQELAGLTRRRHAEARRFEETS